MANFDYGPIELYVVSFDGHGPDEATLAALTDIVEDGTVHLVDLALVAKDADGVVTYSDLDTEGLDVPGLAAEEDLVELGASLEPGTSAAVLVLELLWAKPLASRLAAAGGAVLATERIPAAVVNEALGELEGDEASSLATDPGTAPTTSTEGH